MEPKDAPDSPGFWAWEGYINYAKDADPNRIEREVVRVHWGKITKQWQVVRERGHHPAYMLVGKWWRVTLPWDAGAQGAECWRPIDIAAQPNAKAVQEYLAQAVVNLFAGGFKGSVALCRRVAGAGAQPAWLAAFPPEWDRHPWANYAYLQPSFGSYDGIQFMWYYFEKEPEWGEKSWNWVDGKHGYENPVKRAPLSIFFDVKATLQRRVAGAGEGE